MASSYVPSSTTMDVHGPITLDEPVTETIVRRLVIPLLYYTQGHTLEHTFVQFETRILISITSCSPTSDGCLHVDVLKLQLRDLRQVGSKLQVVLLPRENNEGVLKKLKDCK